MPTPTPEMTKMVMTTMVSEERSRAPGQRRRHGGGGYFCFV